MPVNLGGLAVLAGAGLLAYAASTSMYKVEAGHRAVLYSRYRGVRDDVKAEGLHFRIPYLTNPHLFDIQIKGHNIRSNTGTRDLQMVDLTLNVLYRPEIHNLPTILSKLGENYDEKVLPSIVNETVKSVIAQFSADQLIVQRELVSRQIKKQLEERAKEFCIDVREVSMKHLTFGREYTNAVEAKQVAQQEAERAKFLVKQAMQDKRSTIIKALGEANAARTVGEAVKADSSYIELRQMEAARAIAETVSRSQNKVYLDADSLLLNIFTVNDRLNDSQHNN